MEKVLRGCAYLLITLLSIILISCGEEPTYTIDISKYGKTEYTVGEFFDVNGYELSIKEKNGDKINEIIVIMTEEMVEKFEFTSEGQTKINGVYKNNDVILEFEITVNVKAKEKIATSLEVINHPSMFFEGEEIDLSKFTLKVTYDDNKVEEISATTVSSKINDGAIEFAYKGQVTTFYFTYTKVEVVSVNLVSSGKLSYEIGEKFIASGFLFELTYNNGKIETVELTDDMVFVDEFTIAGSYQVSITFKDDVSTTINVTVNKAKPVSLEVTIKGDEYYTIGKNLDLSEYIFSCIYSDGSKKEVNVTLNNVNKYEFEENFEDDPVVEIITVSLSVDGVYLTCTFEVYVLAEWNYEELVGKMEAEKVVNKIFDDVTKAVPEIAEENFVLPQTKDYGYSYIIVYSTSNPKVVTPSGSVYPQEEDVIVTLTVSVKNDYYPATMDIDIFVKGLGPAKLRPWVESEKHVFAYFYEGTSAIMTEEDAKKVDVINYCFARIDTISGKVTVTGLSHFEENLKLRRSTGVRIVLSVGGGGNDAAKAYISVCKTEETRKVFIQSMIDLIDEYRFDGIDLDWEYPAWDQVEGSTQEDRHRFTLLCKEMREAFDNYKEGLLITAALIGGTNIGRFYEGSELTKYLDYIHIMTYDQNLGGIASHHANAFEGKAYSTEGAIKTYIEAGFDVEKLVIGVAFYGKISTLVTKQNADSTVLNKPVTDTTTIRFTTIYEEYLNNPKFVRLFDEKNGAYYLTDGEKFITYDDPDAIQYKGQLVRKYNIEGLMFWDYGSDETGILLRKVRTEIDAINQGR